MISFFHFTIIKWGMWSSSIVITHNRRSWIFIHISNNTWHISLLWLVWWHKEYFCYTASRLHFLFISFIVPYHSQTKSHLHKIVCLATFSHLGLWTCSWVSWLTSTSYASSITTHIHHRFIPFENLKIYRYTIYYMKSLCTF